MDLWTTLIPLGLATAFLPVQLAITLLMLRSPGGTARAGAWIAGMTAVRLVQYALFGVLLEQAMVDDAGGPNPVEGALLLMVAVFLLVAAARKVLSQPDEDAPPPRWMTVISDVSPSRALLMGAALVALSPKLWAFTLGAIGAIGEAHLVGLQGWLVFLVWLAIAQGLHLAAFAAAVVAPERAEPVLVRAAAFLERSSRVVMIAVGLGFGAWFLVKALVAFGVL